MQTLGGHVIAAIRPTHLCYFEINQRRHEQQQMQQHKLAYSLLLFTDPRIDR